MCSGGGNPKTRKRELAVAAICLGAGSLFGSPFLFGLCSLSACCQLIRVRLTFRSKNMLLVVMDELGVSFQEEANLSCQLLYLGAHQLCFELVLPFTKTHVADEPVSRARHSRSRRYVSQSQLGESRFRDFIILPAVFLIRGQ